MHLTELCPLYLGGGQQLYVLVHSKDRVAVRTSVPMQCA